MTGHYSVNTISDICKSCHKYCKECFGPENTECESCSPDIPSLVLVQGSICSCKKSYYEDKQEALTQNICKPCYDLCSVCVGSSTNCTECVKEDGVILSGNKCMCKERGYTLVYNPNTGKQQCIICHKFYSVCDG